MRKPRSPQNKPTKAELDSYYRKLKQAANGGVLFACAELIKIDFMSRHLEQDDEPVSDLAASGERLLQAHEDLADVVAELRKALADE